MPAAPQTPDAPVPPTAPVAPAQPVAPVAAVTPPSAVATPAPAGDTARQPRASDSSFLGTGRRKTAVARVRIKPGSGKIVVNRRDIEVYFTEPQDRGAVIAPLKRTDTLGRWDVSVRVHGGGPTGQSGAILLGVARALLKADPALEPTLRDSGYLTRDAREVERKKYGHRKARRSFQFSKR